MKRGSRAGVTLIEVLIAVSLLSLLSLGIMFVRLGWPGDCRPLATSV